VTSSEFCRHLAKPQPFSLRTRPGSHSRGSSAGAMYSPGSSSTNTAGFFIRTTFSIVIFRGPSRNQSNVRCGSTAYGTASHPYTPPAGEGSVYLRDQLGHSSIQVPVDCYGHLIPSGSRQAVNRFDTTPIRTVFEAELAIFAQPSRLGRIPPSADRLNYPEVTRTKSGVSNGYQIRHGRLIASRLKCRVKAIGSSR